MLQVENEKRSAEAKVLTNFLNRWNRMIEEVSPEGRKHLSEALTRANEKWKEKK